MTDLHQPEVTAAPGATSPSEPKQAVKDEAGQVASTAAEHGKQTVSVAADATSQVAGTAAEGVTQVASEAKESAAQVTKQASEQARELVSQAQNDLREQASSQTQRAASGLKDASQKVRALADGKTEEAGPALDVAKQISEKIDEAASWLDQRGFDGAVQEVANLARRRPGVFLLSAAATGFVVGRLGRGLQTVSKGSSNGDAASAPAPGAVPATPPFAAVPPAAIDIPSAPLLPDAAAVPAAPPAISADPPPYLGSTAPGDV